MDELGILKEVNIGESWVETAVQGAGAEISIYTKLEDKVVEDFIEIKDLMHLEGTSALMLEEWIEDFDTFEVEPTSFVIDNIHRMQQ